jgi:uncharacterized membrane protein YfcA
VLLALFGLVSGIGTAALGPGGVLTPIALFAFTDLSPVQIAGTAIVTNVATGALVTAAYARSGQLRDPDTRRTALLLAGTAILGAPLGVLINTMISKHAFGLLLGMFVAAVAALVWYRDRRTLSLQPSAHPRGWVIAALGVAVAAASGMFGLGGPMLTVPLLIALRVPVLSALAAAQVQSILIAGVGTLGYLTQGAIIWPLAALMGIPALAGVLVGWVIARTVPTRPLTYALIAALFGLAPYLAFHG